MKKNKRIKDYLVIVNFNILFLTLSFFCTSCRVDHNIYFDISSQELRSCDGKRLRNIEIESELESVGLFWTDTLNKAPKSLNLNKLPKGYKLSINGLHFNKSFNLKSNTSYTIEKWGSGGVNFKIRIWIDSKGNISKTSHPKCGIESLDLQGGSKK